MPRTTIETLWEDIELIKSRYYDGLIDLSETYVEILILVLDAKQKDKLMDRLN